MKFLILSVIVLMSLPVSYGITCISEGRKQELMELAFTDFDQSMGHGWREFAKPGCYLETALLLDQYFELHKEKLVRWQRSILTWHAGQMYAFNNNYSVAKTRFLSSLNPEEPATTEIMWNDYVYASVAFLDKDFETLKKHRDIIADGPTFNGKKQNLWVVDNFIKCFNEPYAYAYSGCGRTEERSQ